MDLLQFADQITIRPLASKLLAVKASQRRGEDVVTSILRACRRLARVARPGDAGVADFAMDIAETHLERLNHLGAGALLEVLFASDRRRDAAFVLNRLRTEEAWPRPTAEIFSIVVRDLILRGEPAEVVEDVLVSPNSADQKLTSFSVAAVSSLYHLSWSVALASSTLFEASTRASFTVAS